MTIIHQIIVNLLSNEISRLKALSEVLIIAVDKEVTEWCSLKLARLVWNDLSLFTQVPAEYEVKHEKANV